MKRSLGLAIVISFFTIQPAHAMTMEALLQSSAKHYPSIQKAREGVEAQSGKVQAAQGAFDWELNQRSVSRVSGFYGGDYSDSKITRRLADSATRIYGGYRVSREGFPVYEDEEVTLSGGEFNAGVALSLWRNRIIDEDRFMFRDAELELKQRTNDLLLTQLGVQYDAMQAYLDWLAAGKAVQVVESLLNIAVKRQDGFTERVSKGDIAEIFLTENKQYLAKRGADVNDAKRALDNRATKLSLFWRDADGKTLVPSHKEQPKDFPKLDSFSINLDKEIERAKLVRPELIKVELGLQRERNKLKLNENKLMPKVDLVAESAQDLGTGSSNQARTRGGVEGKIGLNISIPLQTNTGQGLVRQSAATIKQLEQDSRLLNDQIVTEIQIAANNYSVASKNVVLAKLESSVAATMEQAERKRFDSGAVDFFVLNMREERAAEARLKLIDSQQKLWRSIADYYLATLQADKLLR